MRRSAAEKRREDNDGDCKTGGFYQKKYNEKYEYADPIRGVARDERLKLKMGFDIMNAGFTEYTQIVNVYKIRNSPIRSDHILSGMKNKGIISYTSEMECRRDHERRS